MVMDLAQSGQPGINDIMSQDELVSISQRLLLAIRKCDDAPTATSVSSHHNYQAKEQQQQQLLWLDIAEQQKRLQEQINLKSLRQMSENGKKAFWINVYNSFLQIKSRKQNKQQQQQQPQQQSDGIDVITPTPSALLYTTRNIPIAGRKFSLDDIEHGILRKYRWKFLYGYVPHLPMLIGHRNPISKLAVHKMDCRIHFALNCGAKSCPPIAYYSADKIDHQLDQATRSFLCQETEIASTNQEIYISKIFYWYYGDFGGKRGIQDLLEKYWVMDLSFTPEDDHHNSSTTATNGKPASSSLSSHDIRNFRLIYKGFSWEQNLDNYAFNPDDTGSSSHGIQR
jgi:hypothetical protein